MTQTSTSSSLTEMVSATVLYEISFERLEAHRLEVEQPDFSVDLLLGKACE